MTKSEAFDVLAAVIDNTAEEPASPMALSAIRGTLYGIRAKGVEDPRPLTRKEQAKHRWRLKGKAGERTN